MKTITLTTIGETRTPKEGEHFLSVDGKHVCLRKFDEPYTQWNVEILSPPKIEEIPTIDKDKLGLLFDERWNSIYYKTPLEGQRVASKKSGDDGYAGDCIYTKGYFESYHEHLNRIEIIRWKHDLWLPIKENN